MLPSLRRRLRMTSRRNVSLQDILRTCSTGDKIISVAPHNGGIHNSKITLKISDGGRRVHFYNRIDINSIINSDDVVGNTIEEIITNLNLKGFDFTEDDLELIDTKLHTKTYSLGYYGDPIELSILFPLEPVIKPMIVSYTGGTSSVEVRSHSPLRIDWGTLSRTPEDRAFMEEFGETIEEFDGFNLYVYRARLDFISAIGNRIKIWHADGVSPIDWISAPGLFIEQWWGGGYSSFRSKLADELSGLGYRYILPEEAPPGTKDLSYMFYGVAVLADISEWDVSNVEKMDYFANFNDSENTITAPPDLTSWCVANITEQPRGWEGSELTPVWGTCPIKETNEKDRDSMTIMMLSVDEGHVAFIATTRLDIDTGDTGYVLTESNNGDYGPYYTYTVEHAGHNSIGSLSPIRIRPYSGEGKIKDFGMSRAAIMTQWWKDGYDGFNSAQGVLADILPLVEPPNTTNISNLARHNYISVATFDDWDMSKYKNFSGFFRYRISVAHDISGWDMSGCENASDMFFMSRYTGPSIGSWNMSKATNLANMFYEVDWFFDYGTLQLGDDISNVNTHDLSEWCVALITNKPAGFNEDSVIPDTHLPVWGTCPRGEYIPPEPTPIDPNAPPTNSEDEYVDDWMQISGIHHAPYIYIASENRLEFENNNDHPFSVMDASGYLDSDQEIIGRMYYITFSDSGSLTNKKIRFKPMDDEPILGLSIQGASKVDKWYRGGYAPATTVINADAVPAGLGPYITSVPPIAPPNTNNLYGFFANSLLLNSANLQRWDVRDVTDLRYFLHGASSFNRDLSYWCVPDITSEPVGFATESVLSASRYPKWGTCPVYVPPPPVVPGDGSWMEFTDINGPFILYSLGELEIEVSDDPDVRIDSDSGHMDEEGQVPFYLYVVYLSEYGQSTGPFSNIIRVRPVGGGKMPGISSMYASTIKTWYAAGYESHDFLCNPELFGELTGPAGGQWITNIPATQPTNTTDYRCFFVNSGYTGSVDHWDMREATQADYMFYGALGVTGDLSKWCVPLITSAPEGFSDGSSLQPNKHPVWGTCPRGEI